MGLWFARPVVDCDRLDLRCRAQTSQQPRAHAYHRKSDDLVLFRVVAHDDAFAYVHTLGRPRRAEGEVQNVRFGVVVPLKRAGSLWNFHDSVSIQ